MPRTLFPIDGVITDINGSGANGAKVIIYNLMNNDEIETTTNSSGGYIVETADATKTWNDGDPILVRSFFGITPFRFAEVKKTVTGSSLTVNLTLGVEYPKQPKDLDIRHINEREHNPIANAKNMVLVDPTNPSRQAEFDNKFKVPVHINVEHYAIHKGDSFEIHIDTADTAVTGLDVAFKTLAGSKLAHMIFGFAASDTVLWQIYENATWDPSSGTAIPSKNNNRDDNGNSEVVLENTTTGSFDTGGITKDPTNPSVAGATLFEQQYTYTTKVAGGDTRQAAHEWVLKNDTQYLVRITKTSASNAKYSIDLHWYEHQNE
jgi:hypothetical protein